MEVEDLIRVNPEHYIEIWNDDENSDHINEESGCGVVYDHRQFSVDFCGMTAKYINSNLDETGVVDGYKVYNLYAHIHSGVTLSLKHDGDKWDTSMRGYVLIDENIKDTKAAAEGVVKAWNLYLSNGIYGYTIYKEEKCGTCGHSEFDDISSSGGFIGDDFKTNGMLEDINGVVKVDYDLLNVEKKKNVSDTK